MADPRSTIQTLSAQTAQWLWRFNPLHGLSEIEAQNIYDAARGGNYSRLQWLYANLEKTDPTLLTCVERRTSALVGLDWKVAPRPTAPDKGRAEEQAKVIEEALSRIDNFPDAIAHLGLAFFRGFSHVSPVWDAPGICRHIDLPDGWNFAQDPRTRRWYWNPKASYGEPGQSRDLIPIPDGELVTVEHPRAIDYPAVTIFLRLALAEMTWGQFLERFGIPPAILTMPDGMSEKEVADFKMAAQAFTQGLAGVLPYGSTCHIATEARGQNPFSEFIQHQEKAIVLLATGGTLTSLAESGSGTLAGNAQYDVWREIVKRDGEVIGNALDRGLCAPIVKRLFPNEPNLVRFELGRETALSPSDVLDLAAKAKASGYIIDRDALADAVGMPLERDSAGLAGGFGAFPNAEPKPAREVVANAETDPAAYIDGGPEGTDARRAFAEDMKEAGRLIAALLETPDEELAEAARKAVADLPDTLPEKPKFAAKLEEAIAQGYADGIAEAAKEEPAK